MTSGSPRFARSWLLAVGAGFLVLAAATTLRFFGYPSTSFRPGSTQDETATVPVAGDEEMKAMPARADNELRHGRTDAAEAILHAALDRRPDSVEARTRLVYILEATGRAGEALEHNLALPLESFEADRWLEVAEIAREVADPTHEVEALRRAVARAPDCLDEYAERARTAAMERRFEAALELFSILVEVLPEAGDLRLDLGLVRFELGDLPGAAADFEETVRIDPPSPIPRYHLGLARLASGSSEAALEAYREAMARDTESEFVQRALDDLRSRRDWISDTQAFDSALALLEGGEE